LRPKHFIKRKSGDKTSGGAPKVQGASKPPVRSWGYENCTKKKFGERDYRRKRGTINPPTYRRGPPGGERATGKFERGEEREEFESFLIGPIGGGWGKEGSLLIKKQRDCARGRG